jgi:hypothetical protein
MGNVVSVKALIGELSIKEAGRYWPRFGVEIPAHLFSMSPAENGDRRQSALWLSWSDTATPPDAESLSGLFDRLSAC